MKKIIIAIACCALVFNGAEAKKKKEVKKEEGFVFTTVKENPITSIKNQHRSSTCWSFSGLAFFESELIRMGKGTYDLAEMFLVSKTMQDRAKYCVRLHGDAGFTPGGSFYDAVFCFRNYVVEAGTPPDVLTFAGNGEPTMHPDFEEIVDGVIALRDRLSPATKVSVLTNATMLHRESVRRALMRVENPILKLDSAFDSTVQLIDKPLGNYSVESVVENMKLFEGNCIVQTMFLRGEYEGRTVDNTTPEEVEAWLAKIAEIAPRSVMVYTIDRDTPAPNLVKVPVEELKAIAERVRALGIECSVAG